MQNPNTLSQEQVFAIVGQQHVELVVLRERLNALLGHRCQPCPNLCCVREADPPSVPTQEESP